MKKHIIYTDDYDFEEAKVQAQELYGDNPTEEQVFEFIETDQTAWFEAEDSNLNVKLPSRIIVIAELSLWNGRRVGYKMLNSTISSCLSTAEYNNTWYVDEYGNFRADCSHHDGTNHYLYRMLKEELTEEQIESFQSKLYEGTIDSKVISKYTVRLGDFIGDIYGWGFKKRPNIKKVG